MIWRTGSSPGAASGRLRTISGEGVALHIDGDLPWQPETEVLVVLGEIGHRQVARARHVMSRGSIAVFNLLTHFRPFDLRGQTRYPLFATTEVRSLAVQSRHPGRVLDISLGGLAVEVATNPLGKQVEVPLHIHGFKATLPCEIVGVAGEEGHFILHLKFASLTPPQQAFIRHVVDHLQCEAALQHAS